MFIGSFANQGEKGFTVIDADLKSGVFKTVSESEIGPNPNYFCISKKFGLIYSGNETNNNDGSFVNGITTLKYDPANGNVEIVKKLAVPNGGPCFVSLSPDEDFLLMSSYFGGYIAVIKLDETGIPAGITDTIFYENEEGMRSRAHMIYPDPSGKRIYLTDLGLDRIMIYELDNSSGMLQQLDNGIVTLPKGSGPRHFVFNSNGSKMYVINELNSTVAVFDVNSNGELGLIQVLTTLAEGYSGQNACADIHIGKGDKFLYGSNRGENTIVTYKIKPDGTLVTAGHTSCGGDWPRNFVIDNTGKYLIVGNERSGKISLFTIDQETGLPVNSGKELGVPRPACLKFAL